TLDGQQTARPMTHDLTLRLLASLGARVRQVVVNKLVGETFYAEITTLNGEQQHVVDARPSDALALAVRAGIPIYVAHEVMQQASGPDDDEFWKAMAEKVRQFHERSAAPSGEQPTARELGGQLFCLSPFTNCRTAEPLLTSSAVLRFNRMAMSKPNDPLAHLQARFWALDVRCRAFRRRTSNT